MNKEGFGKFGEGWKGNLREEEEQGYRRIVGRDELYSLFN